LRHERIKQYATLVADTGRTIVGVAQLRTEQRVDPAAYPKRQLASRTVSQR